MTRLKHIKKYKKHLSNSYLKLIGQSIDYRFEDETISDIAAYKAMKVLEKLNQVKYLEREVTY